MRSAMAAVLWVLAMPATAAPMACPRTLRTAQEAIEVPAGAMAEEGGNDWSVLSHVAFYVGDPEPTGRGLPPVRHPVPAREQAVGARSVTAIWDFSAARGAVWLGCHYRGTRVFLLLPVDGVRCAVSWGRTEAGVAIAGTVQGILCE